MAVLKVRNAANDAWLDTTGPQGLQGAQGDQGPQGDQGDSGENIAWPVGSVFLSVVATNPNTLLGYGTWFQIAQGQLLVGFKTGDSDFGTVEGTGGAKTLNDAHTHSVDEYTNNESGHTHDDGSLVNEAHAGHQHTIDPPNTTSGGASDATTGGTSTANSGGPSVDDIPAGTGALTGTPDTHTHTIAHTHEHVHTHDVNVAAFSSNSGGGHNHVITGTTSAGSAHNHRFNQTIPSAGGSKSILNPYFTVYVWKRTE